MWISYSERPLKVVELRHALAVERGSPNLNAGNVPSMGTLLSCCQGLVVVDKEASTVRLIHVTLQEYLRAHPELFGKVHSMMAETCLSYLNSQQVRALSKSTSPDLQSTPFLEYSSVYWGVHAKKDLSDDVKMLALKLFSNYGNHISARTLLRAQKEYSYPTDFDKRPDFSGLHCASFFGIVEAVAGFIEVQGCDINKRDCVGNTPLMWAARNGHERVVEILLRQDNVIPDKPCKKGQTPLWNASRNGHEGVVRILLEREKVNPDKSDNDCRTPLWCAAWNGHGEVVKTLLERDGINPDNPNKDGLTPLWCAAYNGHEGVAKMLLEQAEVNPERKDNDGRTPLQCAADNGHVEVVKLLLERGEINPDSPDNESVTPLWCAAYNGHSGLVKMILERSKVNPDMSHNNGRTPLCCAAQNGHAGVVKILLERDDVDPNKPDNGGRTPLAWAAESGHITVVEMLRQRCSLIQDIVMTAPTDQTVPRRTSARLAKRRFADHFSAPQSAGSNNPIDLSPPAPSESSRRRSKRIRRS